MDAVEAICEAAKFDELKELMNGLSHAGYITLGYDEKGEELLGKEFMYNYPNQQRVRMVVCPSGLCDVQLLHPSDKSPSRIGVLPVKDELHLSLREALIVLGLVRSSDTSLLYR